ncbi:MAG TPA: protease HtpX [Nevskiaceae bacterium]|nr:protease HtpX [Nevskiaceae bacterium]
MRATFLLIATNLAVITVLGAITSMLNLPNQAAMIVFAAVIGFGGAFISLAMSKTIAKMSTRAQVITEPRSSQEMWLVNTVARQARTLGIKTPEVAIFPSPEPNAFATGMNKNAALVAVSAGLLNTMTQDEVEAVLGHEMAHVANGDMVTLTLVQGVVNTFVIYVARVLGTIIDQALFRRDDGGYHPGPGYWIINIVLQMVLGVLAQMIVAWFSRYREFRADAGGAHLAGKRKMVAALQRLQAITQAHKATPQLPREVEAFGISGGIGSLFASHPPLERRIAALQASQG